MIALFDSGYGGLTVLKPIMDLMPEYEYIYIGDNARAPYGNHNKENIIKFSKQAVEYLFDRGATLIIFACNTTSAVALREIQKKYLEDRLAQDRKILGVLIPVAEEAVKVTKNNKIGVVGTKATISSNSYEKEIKKIKPECKVYSKACPLLVPLIEEGWHKKPEAKSILKKYLRPLKSTGIDTLILGCTHYPFMIKDFKSIMGKKINILSSGEIAARSLKNYLKRHPEIEKKIKRSKKRTFLTTDDPEKFKEFTKKYLAMKITPTQLYLEAC
jgi:glutamate racemase